MLTANTFHINIANILAYQRDPKESWLEISNTIGCRVNCAYCPQALFVRRYFELFGKDAPRMLTYDNFCQIISKVPKESFVVFSGYTETFQNPDCTDMVLEASRTGHPIIICTTLVGLSEKNLKRIVKEVKFQQDNGPFVYHIPKDGEARFVCHIPSVDKLENIPVTEEYLRTLDYLLASPILVEFRYYGKEPNKVVAEHIQRAGQSMRRPQLISRAGNIHGDMISETNPIKGKITCIYIRNRRHVLLPNGAVALCHNDFGLKHIIGNILTSDYSSLHESKGWKEVLSGLEDEKINIICRTCNFAEYANRLTELRHNPRSITKIPSTMKKLLYNTPPDAVGHGI